MRRLVAISWLGPALFAVACGSKRGPEITVAVAASLRHVMPPLIDTFRARHGVDVVPSYGASGDLRKQVEGGAPIDAVLFANAKPVDDLVKKGLADESTRRVIATNELVLIGPAGGAGTTFVTLDRLPPDEKIAVGDPGSVPAGQYARDYLGKLGLWDKLLAEHRIVLGGDVAAVLAYARRGEVAAAVVYATETRGIRDIALFDRAAGPDAPKPEIVVAAVNGSPSPRAAHARLFLEFLASPDGQKVLAEHGFGPPPTAQARLP